MIELSEKDYLELRKRLASILPRVGKDRIEAAVDEVIAYVDGNADVYEVEVRGASIDVDHVAYPGGTVGLDAAGNLVGVTFDRPAQVIES